MNKLLSVLLGLTFIAGAAGCGAAHQATEQCGATLDRLCDLILGPDTDDHEDEQDKRIAELESRVSALEVNYETNATLVDALAAQLAVLENLILELQIDLSDAVNSLQSQIDALQTQSNTVVTELAEVQTQYRITELLDPCGDGPGFDEVLLRTSDGELIAYFESGSRRFLSVLPPGSYATTDATGCTFTVNTANQLCDAGGCR